MEELKESLFMVSKIHQGNGYPKVYLSNRVGTHYTDHVVSKSSVRKGWILSVGDIVAALPEGTSLSGDRETTYWELTRMLPRVAGLIIPPEITGQGRFCDRGCIDTSYQVGDGDSPYPGEEWRCSVVRISEDGCLMWRPDERVERIDIHLQDIDLGEELGTEKLWVVRRVSGHVVLVHNLEHIRPVVTDKVTYMDGCQVLRRTYHFPFWRFVQQPKDIPQMLISIEEEIPYKEDEEDGSCSMADYRDRRHELVGYHILDMADQEVPVARGEGVA